MDQVVYISTHNKKDRQRDARKYLHLWIQFQAKQQQPVFYKIVWKSASVRCKQ